MNHSWNGALPSLIARAIAPNTPEGVAFGKVITISSEAEEMDWITKYFVLSFEAYTLSFCFRKKQKDKVLISRRIQIRIHEFLRRHPMVLASILRMLSVFVLIFYKANCKFVSDKI